MPLVPAEIILWCKDTLNRMSKEIRELESGELRVTNANGDDLVSDRANDLRKSAWELDRLLSEYEKSK